MGATGGRGAGAMGCCANANADKTAEEATAPESFKIERRLKHDMFSPSTDQEKRAISG